MRTTLIATVLLAGCNHPPVPPDPRQGQWVLTWSDEFDGPAGTLPDPAVWSYDIGGHGWGNGQLEFDTDDPDNVSLDGEGHLRITARREHHAGNEYTSARIKTEGTVTPRYGRIEARIRLPEGRGLWPAFWLLGDDHAEVGWPDCGEIDVMEARGHEPHLAIGSVHGPGYSGSAALSAVHELEDGRSFADGFHVFGVVWDPDRLGFYVDEHLYHVVETWDADPWVFDHPFFIIVDVAVGGAFVPPPDENTPFPQTMEVDHVRVYARADASG